jgi:hypothetical protein
MRYLPLLFLLLAHWCLGQDNHALSPSIGVKTVSQSESSTSEPTRVVGYSISKASGISSPVAIKIGKDRDKVAQENGVRSESTVVNEVPIPHLPSYHALIIAVENYSSSSGLVALNEPVKDGNKLYLTLTSEYNFPKNQTSILKNPTRAEILQALEDISKKITSKENVLIFYAGHGVWDERLKVGYWLPSDANATNKSNWISNSTVRDYIAGIQAKHTLLVTDACFSGSIFKSRGDAGMTDYAMSKIYQLPSRKAMTSGTLSSVPDQSKFMEYLLKRLKENKEKYLTAKQLFFSLETAVLNNTHTVPQYGTIQDTGDEGGDFVFIKAK